MAFGNHPDPEAHDAAGTAHNRQAPLAAHARPDGDHGLTTAYGTPAFPLGEPGTAAAYTKGYSVVPDLADVTHDPFAARPGAPGAT